MGGLRYLFNVPYGVGKAACDRLAADTATELVSQHIIEKEKPPGFDQKLKDVYNTGETTELSGKCIVELAKDKNLMSLTGKVLLTCDLARRYGLKDVDGCRVVDYTSWKFLLSQSPYMSWLSIITPSFIRVPRFIFSLAISKF
ncbi:hypothetical protein SRHO_G00019000 [Serrasalmus rhombeus]